jgi:spermidine synthase
MVLLVNGKPDASTGSDMSTQLISAHAPMMMHPDPKRVLTIGLASGITVGSIARYSVEAIDCAEISPAMTRAARYFDDHNHRVLDDPRLTMFVADGRNHVALTDRTYDVITSEPSNPWMAGVADLFTKEFYLHCRERLNDGGVMCSFLESYSLDGSSFRSILRTFHEVFPNMLLWQTNQPDFLMIGSKGPIRIDADAVAARLANPSVAADLSRINIGRVEDLFGHVLLDGDAVAAFTAGAPIHTDDSASVEYRSPRTFYTNKDLFLPTAVALSNHLPCDLTPLTGGDDPRTCGRIVDFVRARGFANRGYVAEWKSDLTGALQEYQSAAGLNRRDRILQQRMDFYLGLGRRLIHNGEMAEARTLLERLLKMDQHHPIALVLLGKFTMSDQDFSKAASLFLKPLRTDPTNADALAHLADIRVAAGQFDRARQLYRRLLRSHPDHVAGLNGLARILLRDQRVGTPDADRVAQAVAMARLACRVTRNEDPRSLDTLSAACAAAGLVDEARTVAERALQRAQALNDQELSQKIEMRLRGLGEAP